MSKHWTAVKFMQPRREEAVVASQRLARTKVSHTGVAVSTQPLTNDVSELGEGEASEGFSGKKEIMRHGVLAQSGNT